ncbi:glucokinase [Spiroplasma sp. TIUS-1]|uniref:ROK family protein n=1 Tax=Spiroplasma sp. TIUS-1 TaxID=216963 RepID=UPI0013996736|nr:ROK family protein [Spiroplasma sp. TIUS-1]QHX36061.1 glucokinase [Spiroplasma sp. TIUS-1]
MSKYALSIDMGATTAKCVIFKGNDIIGDFVVETKTMNSLVVNIKTRFVAKCIELDIKPKKLSFVALAVCGIIDPVTEKVIFSANLNIKDYDIKSEFQKEFEVKNVSVMNDAKAAVYGEWASAYKRKPNSMMMYTIGTGIGGGIILNKALILGDSSGLPSEPGHGGGFQTKYKCNCGLDGCLEAAASATAIELQINEVARKSTSELGNLYKELGRDLTIKDINPLFNNNNKEVKDIFIEALEPLAKQIAIIQHVLDAEIFVIGGGPSLLGEELVNIIKNHIDKYILNDFGKHLDVQISKTGFSSGTLGAFEFAKERFKY